MQPIDTKMKIALVNETMLLLSDIFENQNLKS